MALFGSKKNTKAKAAETKEVAVVKNAKKNIKNLSWVLKNPRITEKAAMKGEEGIYCFNVAKDATKETVAAAIAEMYKVTPRQVRMVAIPTKNVFVRGKWGVKGGGKKAYVYLAKGQTIEVV